MSEINISKEEYRELIENDARATLLIRLLIGLRRTELYMVDKDKIFELVKAAFPEQYAYLTEDEHGDNDTCGNSNNMHISDSDNSDMVSSRSDDK